MVPDPGTAVTDPLQPLDTPFGVATTKPLGRLSIKAIVVRAPGLPAGLVMVKVTVVVPFSGMLAAPNALAIVGGATTFKSAVLLVCPVPPSVEVIAPVVLFASPSTVPCTSTLKLHEAL